MVNAQENQHDDAGHSIHRSSFIIPRSAVPAPWDLRGAALVLLDKSDGGLRLLALVHYDDSPVGAYDERAVVAVTRRGPSVVEMQVTSADSMRDGRANWGYPKTLARLSWQRRDKRAVFTADGKSLRARACGPAFPVCLRAWSAQTLDGRPVRAPFQLQGRTRFAFVGRRIAVLVEPFFMRVEPPITG